jgi:hypothetical protein
VKAIVLLCDWAEELNGKLYMMGAGWSRILKVQPLNVTLGVKVYVPWDQANRKHSISMQLLTEDGDPVSFDDRPVETRGDIEVGRPVGMRPGSDIDAAFVMSFKNLDLGEGRYYWVLEIDGSMIERVTFDVVLRKDVR